MLAVLINGSVWPKALGAAILSILIITIRLIVRLIKRASLGSEFKDLEKILNSFGSAKRIEFDIINNGEQKITKSFTPKQLSEFIKIKYQDQKQWQNRDLELYQIVAENQNYDEPCNMDTIAVCHKGLIVKCPLGWSVEKSENNNLPIVSCNDGNDFLVSVSVVENSSIVNSLEKFVWTIQSIRDKFIIGTLKDGSVNGCPIGSVGYAYKYGETNCYGLIVGYQVLSDLVAILHISCMNDWSLLCSSMIADILDSVKYSPEDM